MEIPIRNMTLMAIAGVVSVIAAGCSESERPADCNEAPAMATPSDEVSAFNSLDAPPDDGLPASAPETGDVTPPPADESASDMPLAGDHTPPASDPPTHDQPLNTPPSAPTEVTLTPDAPQVGDLLECTSVPGTDLDGDGVAIETSWVVNGYTNPDVVGAQVTGLDLMSATGVPARSGDQIRCKQRMTDGIDVSTTAQSNAVTLLNSAPTGGSALVGPVAVYEGDLVTCQASGAVDADGDEITWLYAWVVSDVELIGPSESELASAWFDKGDQVICVATPTDGSAEGLPVVSKTIAQVLNSPPYVESAKLTPTELAPEGLFECQYVGFSDLDPADGPLVTYVWERQTPSGWKVLAGQTADFLQAASLEPGDTVRCVVTPHDDEVSGVAVVSNPGVVLAGPLCEDLSAQLNLTVTSMPPSILMVVDRSGSMYDSWSQTKQAVGAVLGDLDPEAQTGLVLYPSGSSCSIANEPQVPLGPNQAGAVVAAMNEAGVGGSTPMGKAMKSARMYLEANATENTTVVLAADGKPSDTCLEDCTDCDCTDNSICLWCGDLIDCTYREVRREVETLNELGIRTFVIGYKGGFGATGFLETLAELGGTANVGDTPFYDAADGSTLTSILTDITGSLEVCTATLDVPATWESMTVAVAGNLTPEDPTQTDGWDLTDDGTLRLFGPACEAAKAPGGNVDVNFSCAP